MAKKNWAGNFGRSILFGIGDSLKKHLEPVTDLANDDNKAFLNNIKDTLVSVKKGQSRINRMLDSTMSPELKQVVDSGIENFQKDGMHFLKTGETTRTKRTKGENELDDMGSFNIDDGGDFGFSEDDLDLSDLPPPEELLKNMKSSDNPSDQVSAQVGAAQLEATNASTKALVEVGVTTNEAIATMNSSINDQTAAIGATTATMIGVETDLAKQAASLQQVLHKQQLESFKSMNDNLASIVSFNTNVVGKYTDAALNYFTDSLGELKKISAGIERAFPEKKERATEDTLFSKLGLGSGKAINLAGYADFIKDNALNKTSFGSTLQMLLDPTALAMFAEQPVQMLTEMVADNLIQKTLAKSMDNFSKAFSDFIPSMLMKIGTWSTTSENPILQTIGEIFGITSMSKKKSLGQYEKGPVPFDGITHRTINVVIPRYLSEIVGLLGGERRAYDYDSGLFKDVEELKKDKERSDLYEAKNALDDTGFEEKLLDYVKTFTYESEAQSKEIEGLVDTIIKNAANSGEFADLKNQNFINTLLRGIDDRYKEFFKAGFGIVDGNMTSNQRLAFGPASMRYIADYNSRNHSDNIVDATVRDNFYGNKKEEEALRKIQAQINKLRDENDGESEEANDLENKLGYLKAKKNFTGLNFDFREVTNRLDSMIELLSSINADTGYLQFIGDIGGGVAPTPRSPFGNGAHFPSGGSHNRASSYDRNTRLNAFAYNHEKENEKRNFSEDEMRRFHGESILSQSEYNPSGSSMFEGINESDVYTGRMKMSDITRESIKADEIMAHMSEMKSDSDEAKEEAREKAEDEKEDKDEEKQREKLFSRFFKWIKKPSEAISHLFDSVTNTMNHLVFGTKDEPGILRPIITNIQDGFKKTWASLKNDFIVPFLQYITGKEMLGGLKNIFSDLKDDFRGKLNEDGVYEGGYFSTIANMVTHRSKEEKDETKDEGTTGHAEIREERATREANEQQQASDIMDRLRSGPTNNPPPEAPAQESTSNTPPTPSAPSTPNQPSSNQSNNNSNNIDGNSIFQNLMNGPYYSKGGTISVESRSLFPAKGDARLIVANVGETIIPGPKSDQPRMQREEEKLGDSLQGKFGNIPHMAEGGKVGDDTQNIIDAIKENTETTQEGVKQETVVANDVKERQKQAAKTPGIMNKFKEYIDKYTGEAGSMFISHIFGTEDKDGNKIPISEQIGNVFTTGAARLSNFFLGTNVDEKTGIKEFNSSLKEAIPKGLAKGTLIGGGLAAASMGSLSSFGLLGSLLLPGGPVGSMVLGLGVGLLSENEKFKKWMFGDKDKEGNRQGGVISKNVIDFVSKNKKTIIGGGLFGIAQSLAGTTVLSGLASAVGLGGLGVVGGITVPVFGTVALSIAGAMAMKSKVVQERLFGKDGKDGKKIGGLMNTKIGQAVKSAFPEAITGGAIGAIGAMAAGPAGLGLLGGIAISPMAAALAGAAVGIGIRSNAFNDALFGKWNEEKQEFESGGLIDRTKKFVTLEIFKPVQSLLELEFVKSRKWFKLSLNKVLEAFSIYKLGAKHVFDVIVQEGESKLKSVFDSIYEVFAPVLDPVKDSFLFLARTIKDSAFSMGNVIGDAVRSMANLPVTLLTAPANLVKKGLLNSKKWDPKEKKWIGSYEEDIKEITDTKNERDNYDNETEDADIYTIKERMKVEQAELKEARKNGYKLTTEELNAKTYDRLADMAIAEAEQWEKEDIAWQQSLEYERNIADDIRFAVQHGLPDNTEGPKPDKVEPLPEWDMESFDAKKFQEYKRKGEVIDFGKIKFMDTFFKRIETKTDDGKSEDVQANISEEPQSVNTATEEVKPTMNTGSDTDNVEKTEDVKADIQDNVNKLVNDMLNISNEELEKYFNSLSDEMKAVLQQAIDEVAKDLGLDPNDVKDTRDAFNKIQARVAELKDTPGQSQIADLLNDPKKMQNLIKQYAKAGFPMGQLTAENIKKNDDETIQANIAENALGVNTTTEEVKPTMSGADVDDVENRDRSSLTSESIVKERKEESFKEKLLGLLGRNNQNLVEGNKQEESLFDKMKKLLTGLLGAAGILGAITQAGAFLKSIFDTLRGKGNTNTERVIKDVLEKFARNFAGIVDDKLFSKKNAEGFFKDTFRKLFHSEKEKAEKEAAEKLSKDAAKKAGEKAGKDGAEEIIEESAKKAAKNKPSPDAPTIRQPDINNRPLQLNAPPGTEHIPQSDGVLEMKGEVVDDGPKPTMSNKTKFGEPVENIEDVEFKEIEPTKVSTGAEEVLKNGENPKTVGEFRKALDKAIDSIAKNETLNKLAPNFTTKFVEKITNVLSALDDKKITKILFKLANGGIKAGKFVAKGARAAISSIPVAGWLVNTLFGVYDAYSGVVDAAELLQINPKDVTPMMRAACAAVNVIMGLPYIIVLDLALEIIHLGSAMLMEDPINIKRILFEYAYGILAGDDAAEDLNKLQNKNRQDYENQLKAEFAKTGQSIDKFDEWKKTNGVSYEDWLVEQNKNETPILDMMRKTTGGKMLFGYNDEETGKYKPGVFSKAYTFLFGKDADENGEGGENGLFGNMYEFLFGKAGVEAGWDEGVIPHIWGMFATGYNDEEGKYHVGMLGRMQNFLFGSNDENGNYKNGIFADMSDLLFGPNNEGWDGSKGILGNMTEWFHGYNDKETGKYVPGFYDRMYHYVFGREADENGQGGFMGAGEKIKNWLIGGIGEDGKEEHGLAWQLLGMIAGGWYEPDNGKFHRGILDWMHDGGDIVWNWISELFGADGETTSLSDLLVYGYNDPETGKYVDGLINQIGFFIFGKDADENGQGEQKSIFRRAQEGLRDFIFGTDESGYGYDFWMRVFFGEDKNDTSVASVTEENRSGFAELKETIGSWITSVSDAVNNEIKWISNISLDNEMAFLWNALLGYDEKEDKWTGAIPIGIQNFHQGFLNFIDKAGNIIDNEVTYVTNVFKHMDENVSTYGIGGGSVRNLKYLLGIDEDSELVKEALDGFTNNMKWLFGKIGDGIKSIITPIGNYFQHSADIWKNNTAGDGFFKWIKYNLGLDEEKDYIGEAWEAMTSGTSSVWNTMAEGFNKFTAPIQEFFMHQINNYAQYGIGEGYIRNLKYLFGIDEDSHLMQDALNGFTNNMKWLFGKIGDGIKSIITPIGNYFQHSADLLTKSASVGDGFLKWIKYSVGLDEEKDYIGEAYNAVENAITSALDTISNKFTEFKEWWGNFDAKKTAKGIMLSVIKKLTGGDSLFNSITSTMKGMNLIDDSDLAGLNSGGSGTGKRPVAKSGGSGFSQADPRWANKNIAGVGDMASRGCLPTAIANATGGALTPDEISKEISQDDIPTDGSGGITGKFLTHAPQKFGMNYQPVDSSDPKSLANALMSGQHVIAGGKSEDNTDATPFTTAGHWQDFHGGYVKGGEMYVNATDPLDGRNKSYRFSDVYRDINAGGPRMAGVLSGGSGNAITDWARSHLGEQWMGGRTSDSRIQCDSFTAEAYKQAGIKEIGGTSTDGTIPDGPFKNANAYHNIGDGTPQPGDLADSPHHVGLFVEDSHIISRDSSGGVTDWTQSAWSDQFGLQGYGSVREATGKDIPGSSSNTGNNNPPANFTNISTKPPGQSGNITSQLPFFAQWDDRWGNNAYDYSDGSTGDTFINSACGPTSMAMVTSWALGKEVLPTETAKFASDHPGMHVSGGTNGSTFFDAFAKSKGFEMKETGSADEISNALKAGKPVITNHDGDKGTKFTRNGHFIVYAGYDSNGKLIVYDPNDNPDNPDKNFVNTPMDFSEAEVSRDSGWIPEGDVGKGAANGVNGGSSSTGTGGSDKPNDLMGFISTVTQLFGEAAGSIFGGKTYEGHKWGSDGGSSPTMSTNGNGEWAYKFEDIPTDGMTDFEKKLWRSAYDEAVKFGVDNPLQFAGFMYKQWAAENGANHFESCLTDNNPGNIRKSDGSYYKYPTIEEGVAAYMKTLTSEDYIKAGIKNVKSLDDFVHVCQVNGYCEGSEADYRAKFNGVWDPTEGFDLTKKKPGGGIGTFSSSGDNRKDIWNYLMSKGVSKVAAAGIMGNLEAESTYDPTLIEGGSHFTNTDEIHVGDERGYGLAQWTYYSRQQGLKDAANAAGKPASDIGVQMDYLMSEGQTPDVLAKMQNLSSPAEAARIWCEEWENPDESVSHLESRRIPEANKVYSEFGSGGSGLGLDDISGLDAAKNKTLIPEMVKKYNMEFDELGNVKGINIPEYNRILPTDDLQVKYSKQRAQIKNYLAYGGKDVVKPTPVATTPSTPKVEPVQPVTRKIFYTTNDMNTLQWLRNTRRTGKATTPLAIPKGVGITHTGPMTYGFGQTPEVMDRSVKVPATPTQKPEIMDRSANAPKLTPVASSISGGYKSAIGTAISGSKMGPSEPSLNDISGLDATSNAKIIPYLVKKYNMEFDELGNVVGLTSVPDYNLIKPEDDLQVKYSKQRAQIRYYLEYGGKDAVKPTQKPEIMDRSANAPKLTPVASSISGGSGLGLDDISGLDAAKNKTLIPEMVKKYNMEFDELGNVKGINIPEYNRILPTDDLQVKYSKQRAQIKNYLAYGGKDVVKPTQKPEIMDRSANAPKLTPVASSISGDSGTTEKPKKKRRGFAGWWDKVRGTTADILHPVRAKKKREEQARKIAEAKKLAEEKKNEENKLKEISGSETPASLAEKNHMEFDGFGNIKGISIPGEYMIDGKEDDVTKYRKQAVQIANYAEWKADFDKLQNREEKADKPSEIKNISDIKSATEKKESTASVTKSDTKPTEVKNGEASKSAGDSYVEKVTGVTDNELINTLKSLDVHHELGQMISLLTTIAGNQNTGNTGNNSTTTTATTNSNPGRAQVEQARQRSMQAQKGNAETGKAKRGRSGNNSYQTIHARNLEISRGGAFKGA